MGWRLGCSLRLGRRRDFLAFSKGIDGREKEKWKRGYVYVGITASLEAKAQAIEFYRKKTSKGEVPTGCFWELHLKLLN